jgi:hypothetical protein
LFISFDVMRTFFHIFSILFFTNLNAQFTNLPNFDQKEFRFGYYLGLNNYDFKVTNDGPGSKSAELEKGDIGFNVGLIGDLKINNFLNLSFEPGLSSYSKKMNFYEFISGVPTINKSWNIKSNQIHLPFLIKINSNRYKNFRPYIKLGLSSSININKVKSTGLPPTDFKFSSINIFYELSVGLDIYLRYFKLSPSIRGLFSVKNEIPDKFYNDLLSDNIKKLESRAIFLNFSFY